MPTRDPQVGWLQDTHVPSTEPPTEPLHLVWVGSHGRGPGSTLPAWTHLGASGGRGRDSPLPEGGRLLPSVPQLLHPHGAELQGSPWGTRSHRNVSRERDCDLWRRGRGLAALNWQLPLTQMGGTTALMQEETGDPRR